MSPSADRTRLIGRATEVAVAAAAEDRLLTLVGPPGVGKTRLAAHLAHASPGAAWIDASGLATAGALQAAVAAVLELTTGGHVGRALAGRGPITLVLDAAEHLDLRAREVLGEWLDEAPELRLLVTSLARLGVPGERVLELAPLSLPDAVALFADRAAAVGAEPGEPRDVEALVEHLDRLPLAIELAAARAAVLTPRQLLQRIAAGQRLLEGGRHGSVQAAIAFAWELLDEPDRRFLAWCGVFRGGFDVDAAEGLWDRPDALDRLASLRSRSMVQREGDRFFLLESVRAHAEARLDERGERATAEARHAAWFATTGFERADWTHGPREVEGARWLVRERRNLLAAFDRSSGDLAARLALVACVGLAMQGPHAKAVEVLERALAEVVDPAFRVRLLRVRASLHKRMGEAARARAVLDRALEEATGMPDLLRGFLLVDSGGLRGTMGDPTNARAELLEAIIVARRAKHVFQEALAFTGLGYVENQAGDPVGAVRAWEEALRRFRELGTARLEGVVCLNLAGVRSAEGRFEEALDLLARAEERFQTGGSRSEQATAQVTLGGVHLAAGRLDEAERALRAGIALEREVGKRDFEAHALGDLGVVAAERGEWRVARSSLLEALDLLEKLGQRRPHARYLAYFGAVEVALGRPDDARRAFATARAALDDVREPALELLEGFLDLAGPGTPEERASAARARLRGAPGGDAAARRLLERAIAGFTNEERAASPAPAAAPREGSLVVGPEGSWFEVDGSERADLSRRGALRRLLLALADQRSLAPGAGLSVERLFAAGWPGERALPTAASSRVYTAISALRSLGLERVLRRHDDGYLLDPELPLERAH